MASIENIVYTDDLDNTVTENVETVEFYDPETGEKREIDLGADNRKVLATLVSQLSVFAEASRAVKAPRKASAGTNSENAKIREWAQANGYQVGDRGRIKAEIVEAYHTAQKPVPDAEVVGSVQVSQEDGVEAAVPVELTAEAAQAVEADVAKHAGSEDEFLTFLRDNMDEDGKITVDSLANAPQD